MKADFNRGQKVSLLFYSEEDGKRTLEDKWAIELGKKYIIGRSKKKVDISIQDITISRVHSEFIFYDKDKMTSCIYNHLSRAINYWKKLLRDKNFDNPECRKLTKLAIKNFQRCITTYWTELTKTSVLFGQKMEDEIKSKIEEREKDLRVAIDKIAHGDAWGIDIIMEN